MISYNWTFRRRLFLAASSGLGLFYTFWGILTLIINGFDVSENLGQLFFSFEIMGLYYAVIFVVLPFCFPKISVVPIWLFLFFTFIFILSMGINSIESLYDSTNFYYSDPYEIRLNILMNNILYGIFILFFLITLSRPVLFYAKGLWKKIRAQP